MVAWRVDRQSKSEGSGNRLFRAFIEASRHDLCRLPGFQNTRNPSTPLSLPPLSLSPSSTPPYDWPPSASWHTHRKLFVESTQNPCQHFSHLILSMGKFFSGAARLLCYYSVVQHKRVKIRGGCHRWDRILLRTGPDQGAGLLKVVSLVSC